MLGGRLIWVLVLIPILSWSQPVDRFQELLSSAHSQKPELATKAMDQFISKLQTKRTKLISDETFLRYMFRETHKTFLYQYKIYSQFPDIFENGNYDCLSATSFFSVILDDFDFQYEIIETNYHIFLLVNVEEKQILIESTDKVNGFVSDKKIIGERLRKYEKNELQVASSNDKYFYQYKLDLYQQVKPHQLPGLLYFNQAVVAFNEKNFVESVGKLKRAIKIYSSPRVSEFVVILVNEIANSDLGDEEKKSLIRPFATFIKVKSSVVASR